MAYDESVGRILADTQMRGKRYSERAFKEYREYLEFKNRENAELNINYNESFKFLPSFPRCHRMIDPKKFQSKNILVVLKFSEQ